MHPSCPSCSRHAINLSSRYWLCRQVNFNTHRGGGKDCEQRLSCDITYAAWFAQDADRWIKSTPDRETAPTKVVPTVSEKRSFWVLIYTQTQYSNNNQFIFIARHYASAVFAVIVCPSVRPSQAGIVSKRLDESSRYLVWRLPFTHPTLCYKEIWVYPKIRVLPSGSLFWR